MYIPECGLYANGSPHSAGDCDASESEFVLAMSPGYIRTCMSQQIVVELIKCSNKKPIFTNVNKLPLLGRCFVEFLFGSLSMCLRYLNGATKSINHTSVTMILNFIS